MEETATEGVIHAAGLLFSHELMSDQKEQRARSSQWGFPQRLQGSHSGFPLSARGMQGQCSEVRGACGWCVRTWMVRQSHASEASSLRLRKSSVLSARALGSRTATLCSATACRGRQHWAQAPVCWFGCHACCKGCVQLAQLALALVCRKSISTMQRLHGGALHLAGSACNLIPRAVIVSHRLSTWRPLLLVNLHRGMPLIS